MTELYECEIRDYFGYVESAALVTTPAEVAEWYMNHGVKLDAVTMTMPARRNVIASYTTKREE